MMNIDIPLFYGERICLAAIDHENDPAIESGWTQEAEYSRLVSLEPALPRSATQIKKKYEQIEKQQDERQLVHFTIRMKDDDRLIGWCQIKRIEWTNGNGWVELGIGRAEDRHQGLGTEALRLLLRYAFGELNMFRLGAYVPAYHAPALGLFKKLGFVQEVCRRESLYRDGRRWDLYALGLLQEEWKASLP